MNWKQNSRERAPRCDERKPSQIKMASLLGIVNSKKDKRKNLTYILVNKVRFVFLALVLLFLRPLSLFLTDRIGQNIIIIIIYTHVVVTFIYLIYLYIYIYKTSLLRYICTCSTVFIN